MRYLPVNAASYVDDFALCEPTFCGQSGRVVLRDFARYLGLPFSDNVKKSQMNWTASSAPGRRSGTHSCETTCGCSTLTTSRLSDHSQRKNSTEGGMALGRW